MAKIVTFSRVFPSTHPKKGEPTYFVEAILTQLGINYKVGRYFMWLVENNPKIDGVFLMKFFDSLKREVPPKSHTIRNHKKPLKVGEFISPKCWADKPYNKTIEGFWQINFAPIIEIKKVWDFEIKENGFFINRMLTNHIDGRALRIAENDGLAIDDFKNWFQFPKLFEGQINCWNEKINY